MGVLVGMGDSSSPARKSVLMLGTDFRSMGGMSAVINVYRRAGFLDNWHVHYVPTHRDGSKWLKLATAIRSWQQVLRLTLSGRISGAHVHVAAGASFWRKTLIVLPIFALGAPVIFHIHDGEFPDFYWKHCGPLGRYLVRKVLERSKHVIALSNSWVGELKRIAPGADVVEIPNPVEMLPVIASLARDPRCMSVLFLGRLSKEKGGYDLLHAFSTLRNEKTQWRLILAGNGELENVERCVAELGLADTVELAGWVGPERKADLLRTCDVLVLPSYFEGLPMAILEAMAAGLPVISSRVGGIPEVLQDSVNGLLFSPGDIPALARCFEQLGSDRSFASRIGSAGRECVSRRFSVQVVIRRLDQLYINVGFVPTKQVEIVARAWQSD